jgi:subtilisin family serine protease
LNRGLLVLALVALALPLAAASVPPSKTKAAPLVEVVVTLKGNQNAFVSSLRREIPTAVVRWRYRLVFNGVAALVPDGTQKQVAALPGVTDVYPSVTYHRSAFRSPAVIGAPRLWGSGLATAGQGIKIGILDEGVDQTHEFFSPAGFTMPPGFPKGQRAFTTAKVIVARAFPPPDLHYRYAHVPFDPVESYHGTHVAGIAAGDNNTSAPGPTGGTVKVSGIAPRAYLGNYRVYTIPTAQFGLDGNSPEIAAGIEAAIRDGMNVINLSLGEPEITPSRDIVVKAIDGAARHGVVPVIAAGNDFEYLGPGTINSPGSAPLAITVAAASNSRTIASFSSAGPTPYSLNLKPDVSAPGESILSSVPARYGTWRYLDGTSMAAPHVAGGAALLLQRHPNWTVAQVKSALMLTGNPVAGARKEVPPTREGGGMIWLPRADRPLVFAAPSSLSFGLLHRGQGRRLRIRLTDAGGGAGSWSLAVRRSVTGSGVRISAPRKVSVPGSFAVRVSVARRAPDRDTSGFVILRKAGQVRRIPFWLHVTAAALAREPHRLLRGPGVYSGDTRRGRSLVSAYRFPANPAALGVPVRLPGPEQVFRFVLRKPAANAGAVVLTHARGVRISPRLVRAGDEDRLAGYTGLPIRINPYKNGFYDVEPAVGVFRPTPGAYDVVFDTSSRAAAGRFTFRFWVNDTTRPTVRLLTPRIAPGAPLRLLVRDRGSGVDAQSLYGVVDGSFGSVVYNPRTHQARLDFGRLKPGRHRLVFGASDWQETKNNENAAGTLMNTRRLTTTFVVQ